LRNEMYEKKFDTSSPHFSLSWTNIH
jgi:hypothetical protein